MGHSDAMNFTLSPTKFSIAKSVNRQENRQMQIEIVEIEE